MGKRKGGLGSTAAGEAELPVMFKEYELHFPEGNEKPVKDVKQGKDKIPRSDCHT